MKLQWIYCRLVDHLSLSSMASTNSTLSVAMAIQFCSTLQPLSTQNPLSEVLLVWKAQWHDQHKAPLLEILDLLPPCLEHVIDSSSAKYRRFPGI